MTSHNKRHFLSLSQKLILSYQNPNDTLYVALWFNFQGNNPWKCGVANWKKTTNHLFFKSHWYLMQHILFWHFLACTILQLEKDKNNFNSVSCLLSNAYIILEYRVLIKLFTFFFSTSYFKVAYLSWYSWISNTTIGINWECYSGRKIW